MSRDHAPASTAAPTCSTGSSWSWTASLRRFLSRSACRPGTAGSRWSGTSTGSGPGSGSNDGRPADMHPTRPLQAAAKSNPARPISLLVSENRMDTRVMGPGEPGKGHGPHTYPHTSGSCLAGRRPRILPPVSRAERYRRLGRTRRLPRARAGTPRRLPRRPQRRPRRRRRPQSRRPGTRPMRRPRPSGEAGSPIEATRNDRQPALELRPDSYGTN
jgi:hypothetical protein